MPTLTIITLFLVVSHNILRAESASLVEKIDRGRLFAHQDNYPDSALRML